MMAKQNTPPLLTLVALAAHVAAHGHVMNLIINGISYEGYDSTSFPYQENPPQVAGWTIDQLDNGPVYSNHYDNPDIICHINAKPAPGHIEVEAGDVITFQWNTNWPNGHHGPVMDYLAPCYGPCETVDKTTLEFFKIDGIGLLEQGSQGEAGTYAEDVFIENGYTWTVQVPKNIAPGNYVLRHEIIALHNAIDLYGAQNYPQCFNLKITGDGSDVPMGYLGTELYDAKDPGILLDIYAAKVDYQMPGPTICDGGVSSVSQSPSSASTSATCTLYG